VGLIFFARRMMELDGANPEYGDVIERALYNGVLSSFGIEGRTFFYTNPQEATAGISGRPVGEGDPALAHVKINRQKWYGCACCPTNAARLLSSIEQYAYSFDEERNVLRCQLLIPGEQTCEGDYGNVTFRTETRYPWDGAVTITVVDAALNSGVDVALRIPAWARGQETDVRLPQGATRVAEDGFLRVKHAFAAGDRIAVTLPMAVRVTRAHAAVREDAGMLALERGPLVYCAEATDNGTPLHELFLSQADAEALTPVPSDQLGGTVLLTGTVHAARVPTDAGLYHSRAPILEQAAFTAIPYFQWSNRGETDMRVWLRELL
jgi:DUF1680 family protein